MEITYESIGIVKEAEDFRIELDPSYRDGLVGLEGFSHVVVIWHANLLGNARSDFLLIPKPYVHGPDQLGVFATRSPFRPNSICSSIAKVEHLDVKQGLLVLDWLDAEVGTPVLDIKPYHGSEDRIRELQIPAWCKHWPLYREDSATFDWQKEFTFAQE